MAFYGCTNSGLKGYERNIAFNTAVFYICMALEMTISNIFKAVIFMPWFLCENEALHLKHDYCLCDLLPLCHSRRPLANKHS